MKTERKKKFYLVQYGWGGQHGDFIEEIYLTESEFRTATASPCKNKYGGALFRKYIEALYYICD